MQENNFSVNVGGQLLDLSEPCVMTIINVTPDSFWSGSRSNTEHAIVQSVERAINDGASILDIGGYSTRPGADEVSEQDEITRVVMALKAITATFGKIPIPISIDTFRSTVVERVLEHFGAVIVNDISSGEDDSNMLSMVGKYKLPYVAMHKRGTPQTMSALNSYDDDIVTIVLKYFAQKINYIRSFGIDDLILDVGFGFAKDTAQNFELIRRYNELKVMGLPTLAGISRKRMIWNTLGIDIADALNGTSALHWQLLSGGASILRVHDTKEAMEIVKLHKLVMNELS